MEPLIDAPMFPNAPPALFWSLRPGFDGNLDAWMVHFGNGRVYGYSGQRKFHRQLIRTNL